LNFTNSPQPLTFFVDPLDCSEEEDVQREVQTFLAVEGAAKTTLAVVEVHQTYPLGAAVEGDETYPVVVAEVEQTSPDLHRSECWRHL